MASAPAGGRRRGSARRAAGLVLAAATLTLAGPAAAYVRSVSEAPYNTPLWWQETEQTFVLDDRGTDDVPGAIEFQPMRASFATWNAVQCDYGPRRPRWVDGGTVSDREAGYSPEGDNENLLIFIDDPAVWRERKYSASAIAITSVTHDKVSGRIFDTDIEFNDADFTFVIRSPALPLSTDNRVQDLQNTATHEIGHMIGLDHSLNSGATMYYQANAGETAKRQLASDDLSGACVILPPDKQDSPDVGCACATAPGASGEGGGPGAGAAGALALLLLGVVRGWGRRSGLALRPAPSGRRVSPGRSARGQ